MKQKVVRVLAVLAATALAVLLWCKARDAYLYDTEVMGVSWSEALRNLALFVGAPIGIGLAVWRSWVAEKQVEKSQQQVDVAKRHSLHERYQAGVSALASSRIAIRMGGIYSMERFIVEREDEYYLQIVKVLAAFIRNPPPLVGDDLDEPMKEFLGHGNCRPDVEAAAQAIGKRSKQQTELEKRAKWVLDLQGANLSGARLFRANLAYASLAGTKFHRAALDQVCLSQAWIVSVQGITQNMLDSACQQRSGPKIESSFCPESKKLLIWRGDEPFKHIEG